jgi:hypothetical protein
MVPGEEGGRVKDIFCIVGVGGVGGDDDVGCEYANMFGNGCVWEDVSDVTRRVKIDEDVDGRRYIPSGDLSVVVKDECVRSRGISVRRRELWTDAFRESSECFESDVQRESTKEGGRRRIV